VLIFTSHFFAIHFNFFPQPTRMPPKRYFRFRSPNQNFPCTSNLSRLCYMAYLGISISCSLILSPKDRMYRTNYETPPLSSRVTVAQSVWRLAMGWTTEWSEFESH
jgi:hypothetical protein